MKNKSPKCPEIIIPENYSIECNNYYNTSKDFFKDGKYYRNEKYFGDIIYTDEKTIQVECKNGNIFMEGQILTIQLVKS